jgi:hypothetical protein
MLQFRFAFIGLTFSLLVSTYAAAEIYKTVDKDGRVTYSDTPPVNNTNAKPIELKSINTTPSLIVTPNSTVPNAPSSTQNATAYDLKILAPANGTTLMANERSVTISISLNQQLLNGDALAYKIDGNLLIKTTEPSFTLNEPPRGEHSLTVDVVDGEGNTLAQSDATTIVVMRPLPKQTATPVPKK